MSLKLKKTTLIIVIVLVISQVVAAQLVKSVNTVKGKLGKKLDHRMSELVEKGFSGQLLVARKGKIILAKGYGLADREKQSPVTTDTAGPIGSVTKQFTGAAILKLEMQGKLNINDPITKYFKDAPPDKEGITIHHLLTHTSGIPTPVGRCQASTTRDDFVRMALNSKLESKPGEKYSYSNHGYELLGAIIEIASGKSYEQYLNDNLFRPSGMNKTGNFLPAWKPNQITVGYRDGKRWGTFFEKIYDLDLPATKPNGYVWCSQASGGILSTVNDLYKWHLALEGNRVLSAEAKRKYFTPHVAEGEGATSYYGYGWAIFTTPRKTKLIAHNGGVNDVFYANFRRYVEEQVVFIIITNSLFKEQGEREVSREVSQIIFNTSR
jgi:CubicO group peptidase (beta-lactamase class C family)